jgi:hypothetical protein
MNLDRFSESTLIVDQQDEEVMLNCDECGGAIDKGQEFLEYNGTIACSESCLINWLGPEIKIAGEDD